jgi:RsiW-degrading membrane proteinase PrsW (M82 family)|tara:strand:- start:1348 stop:1557 length:210 start_codon:yes stop_codon:yes gene_type:complete
MNKLIEGHNWVYLVHVVLVAPLLILIPLAQIYKKELNLSDNFILMLMYTLIAFGIVVFFYHGNKLRNAL